MDEYTLSGADKAELEAILALAIAKEKTNPTCREIARRLEAVLISAEWRNVRDEPARPE